MRKFALIGFPVAHSLSPALFKAAYPSFPQDTYDLIESNSIEEAFAIFLRKGYTGANVTSPHKEAVVRFCDHTDDIVKRVGASNLIIKEREEIYGYNTDYTAVRELATPFIKTEDASKTAIVTGAGGAGRAAVYALIDLGFKVSILNRTPGKATCFTGVPGVVTGVLEDIAGFDSCPALLVHTIDHPLPGTAGIDFSKMTIIEANYKSPNLANIASVKYISGREWLISQAIPAFKIFTGAAPDIERMKSALDFMYK